MSNDTSMIGDTERQTVADAMNSDPVAESARPASGKTNPAIPHVNLDAYVITFGDEDDPTTWVQVRTVVIPKDSTAGSALVAKHPEWGSMDKNPIPFLNAQLYYSLRRKGRYAASYDQFMDEVIDFTKVDTERVDPTRPGTGSD